MASSKPVPLIERIRKPSASLSRVSVCIYGKGGVGKTTLLSTMPKKGLVIDIPQIEGGTSVLAGLKDDIDVLPVVNWAGLDEALKFLRGSDHGYKWVAVDTITACQELARRKSVDERDGELDLDPYTLDQRDWGKIGTLMGNLFYTLRLLSMNTILLAQESTRRTADGGDEYIPDVSPFSFRKLCPPQHLVARLYMWQVADDNGNQTWERRLRTGHHATYYTKTRNDQSRVMADVLKSPHLGRILAWMLGKEVSAPQAAEDESTTFSIV